MTTPPAVQPLSPSDERLWATLIHVGGIIFYFLSPLLGYIILRDRSTFVRENSRNALNFQLTMLIAYVAGTILTIVFIGILVIIAAAVVNIIFSILAAVAANKGETYKYPLSIAFVKN